MSMERLAKADVDRHKAAITRSDLSRPVKVALEAGLFKPSTTFFDYGCGHGGDIERIAKLGISASGWDPHFRPQTLKSQSDVVNLGYVLNVIENPEERRAVLKEAWSLTNGILVVSAQILLDYLGDKVVAFGDGVLTKRNTFQKVFKQEELKEYIDSTLSVDSVPAGLGIYFVFRREAEAESFRASRFHSRRSTPRVRLKIKTFEESEAILRPLMDFVSNRGRLPLRGECPGESELIKEFGSINRAFKLVVDATNKEEWDDLIQRRKQDFSLYIALSKFGKRPKIGQLPEDLQNDIKAFFGSYKSACDYADTLLFSLGQPGIIAKTCTASKIGKLLPDALYVHLSALGELDLILRLYEGCASRTVGRMDGATLVKFHTDSPKISYLFYPDFDTKAHPALQTSMRIDLRDLNVKYTDYSDSENPPILHRKESFVSQSYPLYEEFKRLTEQEVSLGLLENTNKIGYLRGWNERLAQHKVSIVDHVIVSDSSTSKADFAIESDTSQLSTKPTAQPDIATLCEIPNSPSKHKEHVMTFEELRKFIESKMSTTHVYQPAMLLALMENNGKASIAQMASVCAELERDTSEADYAARLKKYPVQALLKHAVIVQSGPAEFALSSDWTSWTAEQHEALKQACKSRWNK